MASTSSACCRTRSGRPGVPAGQVGCGRARSEAAISSRTPARGRATSISASVVAASRTPVRRSCSASARLGCACGGTSVTTWVVQRSTPSATVDGTTASPAPGNTAHSPTAIAPARSASGPGRPRTSPATGSTTRASRSAPADRRRSSTSSAASPAPARSGVGRSVPAATPASAATTSWACDHGASASRTSSAAAAPAIHAALHTAIEALAVGMPATLGTPPRHPATRAAARVPARGADGRSRRADGGRRDRPEPDDRARVS